MVVRKSLCIALRMKLVARTFDEGLWPARGDGRLMLVAPQFTEKGPERLRLQLYAGRLLLQFAAGVTLRPKDDYFARHRAFHGMRG